MSSKYEYPQLPRADIISWIIDCLNIGVSDVDFRRPNPDFLSNVYTKILVYLNFINEDFEQVDFSALEQFENPDLHIYSVRMMNLLKKMKVLLHAIDCPKKFVLKDLIKPDPDRTECFLSAIVNFCVYRETKMELLKPIAEEHRLVEEQGKELGDRILQLNAEIEEVNASKAKEKPLIQAVEAKVKELRQTIPNLNNQQVSLKASLKKMKEKCKDIDEKISSAEFALVQSVQENASLRSRIVQSPDKLLKTLEEKKLIRAESEDAERVSMQTYQEKNTTFEVFTKAHKKLPKILVQVQAIQEQVNSAKSDEKEVKALKVKHREEDMLDKALQAKITERQGRVDQVNESIKLFEKEIQAKYEETTKEHNNLKLDVEPRRRDLEARQKQIEAVVAEVDAINMEINALKEAGNAKRGQLNGKMENIVAEFFKYNNSIGVQLLRMEVEAEHLHGSH